MRIPMVALAAALSTAAVVCQDTRQSRPTNDVKAEIKERMKQRHQDLAKLRDGEKVGETWEGLVEAVKPAYAQEKVDAADQQSPTIGDLVAAENQDRKALFELLAKDLKTTAAEIGKQNGIRSIEKAKDAHWLRLEGGKWAQKKDVQPVRK